MNKLTSSLNFIFVLLHILCASPFLAAAEDWPGWRGNNAQGYSQGSIHPVNWSQNESVIWKTTIDGVGYSSPVVVGNHVFVMTAWKSAKAGILKDFVTLFQYILAFFGTLFCIPFLISRVSLTVTKNINYRELFSKCLFLTLWGSVILFCFFGENLFNYSRSDLRAWLATSLWVSICFILGFWVIPRSSMLRLFIGLLAIGFSLFSILCIPIKDHALRDGLLSRNSAVVMWTGAMSFVSGATMIFGYFSQKNTRHKNTVVSRLFCRPLVRRIILCCIVMPPITILIVFLLRMFIPVALEASHDIEYSGSFLPLWPVGLCVFFIFIATLGSRYNRFRKSAFLILVCSLAALMLVLILISLEAVVRNSSYLAVHWGTPQWVPALGWAPVFIFLAAIIFGGLCYVRRISNPQSAIQSNFLSGFGITLVLLVFITFANANFLHKGSEYVRAIVCLDRENGTILWKCTSLSGIRNSVDHRNSLATPTPVVHSNRIFAYFDSVGMIASDFHGKLLWENSSLLFSSPYGAASSPVAADGLIIQVCDMPHRESRIWGLDAITGKVIWYLPLQQDGYIGGNNRTPEIKRMNDRNIVLIWRTLELLAVDVLSGKLLWRCPVRSSGDVVTSSVSDSDTIYLTQKDRTQAIALRQDKHGLNPVLWRNTNPGANCSSPVLVQGMIFLVSENGEASCIKSSSGELLWREKLPGQYRSSVVANDKHVYFSNTKGLTTVVACDEVFKRVTTNCLNEPLYSSIAATSGDFIVRTEKSVYRIRGQ